MNKKQTSLSCISLLGRTWGYGIIARKLRVQEEDVHCRVG